MRAGRGEKAARLAGFSVPRGAEGGIEATANRQRRRGHVNILSALVCQGPSTKLEIRLSQLDVPHNTHTHQCTHTHMHKHPVTGLPVKQSEHEGPEDLAGGEGGKQREEECRI